MVCVPKALVSIAAIGNDVVLCWQTVEDDATAMAGVMQAFSIRGVPDLNAVDLDPYIEDHWTWQNYKAIGIREPRAWRLIPRILSKSVFSERFFSISLSILLRPKLGLSISLRPKLRQEVKFGLSILLKPNFLLSDLLRLVLAKLDLTHCVEGSATTSVVRAEFEKLFNELQLQFQSIDVRLTAIEGSAVSSSSATAALEDETRDLAMSLKSMHAELRKYAVAAN